MPLVSPAFSKRFWRVGYLFRRVGWVTLDFRKMLWGPLRGDGQTFQGGGLESLRPPGFEKAVSPHFLATFPHSFAKSEQCDQTREQRLWLYQPYSASWASAVVHCSVTDPEPIMVIVNKVSWSGNHIPDQPVHYNTQSNIVIIQHLCRSSSPLVGKKVRDIVSHKKSWHA